jgi:deazaflavin-dependent oxidoreductase (nitroreductase family)
LRPGTASLRFLQRHGWGPGAFALLETTGRRSGRPRQTPVGDGLDGRVFWLVAAHGRQADFVRNIEAQPRVRVRVGRGPWLAGVATLLPDDDVGARSRTLPHRWDAALGRAIATTPMTVRIDLDA